MQAETNVEYIYDSDPDEDLWPAGDLGKHLCDLEKVFTCGICKGFMSNPQILPCQHSYCMECINRCMDTVLWQNARKECPTCRKECVPTQCKPNTSLSTGILAFRSARKLLLEQLHKPAPLPPTVAASEPTIIYVYRDAPPNANANTTNTAAFDDRGAGGGAAGSARGTRGRPSRTAALHKQSQSQSPPASQEAASVAPSTSISTGGEEGRKSSRKRKSSESYAAYDYEEAEGADAGGTGTGTGTGARTRKGRGKSHLDDVYDAYAEAEVEAREREDSVDIDIDGDDVMYIPPAGNARSSTSAKSSSSSSFSSSSAAPNTNVFNSSNRGIGTCVRVYCVLCAL